MNKAPYIALSDAAAKIGVSKRTISNHVAGVAGAFQVGRTWFVPAESLESPPLSELPMKRGPKKEGQ